MIIYPTSWDEEDNLTVMDSLKKESKQVNVDFWEQYDKLKKENKNSEEEILFESYRLAKRKAR